MLRFQVVGVCLSLAVVAACTEEGDEGPPPPPPARAKTLAELPRVGAEVLLEQVHEGVQLDVGVRYDGWSFSSDGGLRDAEGAFCPEMGEGFSIKLDGTALPLATRGAWTPNGLDEKYRCSHPRVTTVLPPAVQRANSTLVISDESKTITIPLGDRLLARAAEVANPASGEVTRAQDFTVRFTPSGSLAGLQVLRVALRSPRAADGSTSLLFESAATAITAAADTATFNFPLSAPAASGLLRFELTADQVCGDECSIKAKYQVDRAVVVR